MGFALVGFGRLWSGWLQSQSIRGDLNPYGASGASNHFLIIADPAKRLELLPMEHANLIVHIHQLLQGIATALPKLGVACRMASCYPFGHMLELFVDQRMKMKQIDNSRTGSAFDLLGGIHQAAFFFKFEHFVQFTITNRTQT